MLGSLILYLKGMRIMTDQPAGFHGNGGGGPRVFLGFDKA